MRSIPSKVTYISTDKRQSHWLIRDIIQMLDCSLQIPLDLIQFEIKRQDEAHIFILHFVST